MTSRRQGLALSFNPATTLILSLILTRLHRLLAVADGIVWDRDKIAHHQVSLPSLPSLQPIDPGDPDDSVILNEGDPGCLRSHGAWLTMWRIHTQCLPLILASTLNLSRTY